MKKLAGKILLLSFMSLTSVLAYSQNSHVEELKLDLVEIKDGKYFVDDFALLKINNETFQIELAAEAPTDVISRDNFISYYSTYGTMIILTMFEAAGLSVGDIDLEDLDELIGDPDIVVRFVMAKNGVQIQITSDEGIERFTMSWDEFLGD